MDEVPQRVTEPLPKTRMRAAGVDWPLPLHERLDQLVERANEQGARTNRRELSAALLLGSPEDRQRLLELVLSFRTAQAGDALLDLPEDAAVIPLRQYGPGRRRGS